MVQELAPGGKESSAGWTAHLGWDCSRLFLSQNFWPHQLFLTVAPHMLFEFGDCGDNDFTTCGSRIAERARLHWLSLSISSSSFLFIICPTCPLTKQGFLPFQRICMIVEVQEEVLKPSSQFLVNGKLSLRQALTSYHFKENPFYTGEVTWGEVQSPWLRQPGQWQTQAWLRSGSRFLWLVEKGIGVFLSKIGKRWKSQFGTVHQLKRSLRRGVRSDVQSNCTDTRLQKCSQSGKNGSRHPMLSISMAYNVISWKNSKKH